MADAPHSKCGGKPCRFKSDCRYHKAPECCPGAFVFYEHKKQNDLSVIRSPDRSTGNAVLFIQDEGGDADEA